MDFFTVDTTVYAHNEKVAQEYFRFQIITRSWIAQDDDQFMEWQTHIVSIGRDGHHREVFHEPPFPTADDWWKGLDLSIHRMERHDYVALRNKIAAEHAEFVRRAMA